jgi:hypothetical protein
MKVKVLVIQLMPGANPTTSEFTTRYIQRQPCSRLESRRKSVSFQSTLGNSWRCGIYSAGVVTNDRRSGSCEAGILNKELANRSSEKWLRTVVIKLGFWARSYTYVSLFSAATVYPSGILSHDPYLQSGQDH